MEDLLKPRDLRLEECQPAPPRPSVGATPDEIAAYTKWMNYAHRWQEANEFTPETYAFNWLATNPDAMSTRVPPLLSIAQATTGEGVPELLEAARTDPAAFKYACDWLDRKMVELDWPLTHAREVAEFRQWRAAGGRADGRGKGKATTTRNARLRALAAALQARYGLPLYYGSGNLQGTTCPVIATAVNALDRKLVKLGRKRKPDRPMTAEAVWHAIRA